MRKRNAIFDENVKCDGNYSGWFHGHVRLQQRVEVREGDQKVFSRGDNVFFPGCSELSKSPSFPKPVARQWPIAWRGSSVPCPTHLSKLGEEEARSEGLIGDMSDLRTVPR